MPNPFTVRILPWRDAMAGARPVREQVFVREQGVPIELEWDEWDACSEHAIAEDGAGQVLGTARLLPDGRIGRMAVLAAYRGNGVGEALLSALIERARLRGQRCVQLHAQTHAEGFYRRFGFRPEGETFLEAGIAHVAMTLELSTPASRS
jgi:predicted GNAT family N-acyltransferase